MPTCPFCGSTIEKGEHLYYCIFCDMELMANQIQYDGSRRQISFEEPASLKEAELSTKELIEKDSYYLTCLLRLVRQERARIYNYLRIFKKANEQQGDFLNQAADTGSHYEYWTRKAWVLENILRERSGFFPAKISDKFLAELLEQIKSVNAKPMEIMNSRKKQHGFN